MEGPFYLGCYRELFWMKPRVLELEGVTKILPFVFVTEHSIMLYENKHSVNGLSKLSIFQAVLSNEAGSFFHKEWHVWTVYRRERLSQILFERKGWLYTGYTYRDASKPSRREARDREKIRRKRGEGTRRKRLWKCRSHPYIFSIFPGHISCFGSPQLAFHSVVWLPHLNPPPPTPLPWPNGRKGLVRLPTLSFRWRGLRDEPKVWARILP